MVYPLATSPTLPRDGRQSDTALLLQRGVSRLFRARGFAVVSELALASGRRADIVALGPGGEIAIVEIKSSIEDFRADGKWADYGPFCDRFYFASHSGVPAAIFPEPAGLIMADGYGGEILREPPLAALPAARRKAMTIRFGQAAAHRLHRLFDPESGFETL